MVSQQQKEKLKNKIKNENYKLICEDCEWLRDKHIYRDEDTYYKEEQKIVDGVTVTIETLIVKVTVGHSRTFYRKKVWIRLNCPVCHEEFITDYGDIPRNCSECGNEKPKRK
jgi:hypothetical protein